MRKLEVGLKCKLLMLSFGGETNSASLFGLYCAVVDELAPKVVFPNAAIRSYTHCGHDLAAGDLHKARPESANDTVPIRLDIRSISFGLTSQGTASQCHPALTSVLGSLMPSSGLQVSVP